MRFYQIELRHWRAFVAAAETEHFRAAAERLKISQPALSQLIRTLETQLDCKLFERRGRRVVLTRPGGLLLRDAVAVIEHAERAEHIGAEAGRRDTRTLAAGYVGSAAFHPSFAALMRGIGDLRPSVALRMEQCSATIQGQRLTDHTLDFGVIRSPLPQPDFSFASLRLARERMAVALPASHPMAALRRCRLAKLAGENFIQYLPQPSGGLRELTDRACRAAGFEPRVAQVVPQIATMLCFVGAGLGIALVPETMVRMVVPDVVYRPLEESVATDLMLVYRRSETAPAFRAVLRLARQLARQDRDR